MALGHAAGMATFPASTWKHQGAARQPLRDLPDAVLAVHACQVRDVRCCGVCVRASSKLVVLWTLRSLGLHALRRCWQPSGSRRSRAPLRRARWCSCTWSPARQRPLDLHRTLSSSCRRRRPLERAAHYRHQTTRSRAAASPAAHPPRTAAACSWWGWAEAWTWGRRRRRCSGPSSSRSTRRRRSRRRLVSAMLSAGACATPARETSRPASSSCSLLLCLQARPRPVPHPTGWAGPCGLCCSASWPPRPWSWRCSRISSRAQRTTTRTSAAPPRSSGAPGRSQPRTRCAGEG